jgi:hypothetical protein
VHCSCSCLGCYERGVTLAAMAGVNTRARQYEDSGAFRGLPVDALRAYAFVDLLKGTPAGERIACALAQGEGAEIAEALAWANARAARNAAQAKAGHPGEPGAEPAITGDADERNDGHDGDADSSRRRGDPGDQGDSTHDGADSPAAHRTGNTGGPSGDNDSAFDRSGDRAGTAAGPSGHDRGIGSDDNGDHDQFGGHRHRDDDDPGDDEPGPGGPGAGGPDGGEPGPAPGSLPAGRAAQRLPDLVVPLLTLLGLAERPGEVQGFGLLDPALARSMAAVAAASPRTEVCVTVTSPEGYAIGHGCARAERSPRSAMRSAMRGAFPAGLSARLNLTIPAEALTGLIGSSSAGGTGSWNLGPRVGTGSPDGTDPPGGSGTWALTLPGGRRLTVRVETVPTASCDHRYESHGYHPGAKLRHLVQVRDGTCTFPSCNRHARESDFEHAVPFEKGGRTCTCNAGARSRACHRIKQTKGWVVRQPRPGWHQWTTPAGRVYIQEPKRYPA